MSLAAFVLRSILLAPWVLLRCLPVFIVTILIFAALFWASFQQSNPISILAVNAMLGIIIFFFVVPFLYVQAIRAGLATLGLAGVPDPTGLVKMSLRMLLFTIVIAIVSVIACAAPFALFFSIYGNPFESLMTGEFNPELDMVALASAGLGFVVYALVVVSAISALVGVPMAACGANAATRSPGHDMIFGIGKQFWKLFAAYLISQVLPTFVLFILDSLFLEAATESLLSGTLPGLWVIPLVILYVFMFLVAPFAYFSSIALAYKLTIEDNAQAKEEAMVAVFDMDEERQNLAAMRKQRVTKSQGASVYDPSQTDSGTRRAKQDMRTIRRERMQQAQAGGIYDPNKQD